MLKAEIPDKAEQEEVAQSIEMGIFSLAGENEKSKTYRDKINFLKRNLKVSLCPLFNLLTAMFPRVKIVPP